MTARTFNIVSRSISSILPADRNARTHSSKQILKISKSIDRFGFVTPILIDKQRKIIAGHGRWLAAKRLGLEEVPTLEVDLPADELRALALADNQLAASSGWDPELLALELAELKMTLPDLDLTDLGFEIEQIEISYDVAGSKRSAPEREYVPDPIGPAVTRKGDLWCIGKHRLLCGDALNALSFQILLRGALADLVVGDPPYNVPIKGHVTGQMQHREFEIAAGEMSRRQFQRFLSDVCNQLRRFSRSGSLHYLFMDWRLIADLIAAGEEHYSELINIIVWAKHVGGMGSLYRSRHELIALFRNGTRPHINNIELGKHGRNRTNVWEYPGVNGFGAERSLAKLHPTVKNRAMIADAIRDASHEGDIVLDPFGGSGTTLLAAHDTSRRAGLIELDPLYCDVCIKRALHAGLTVTLWESQEPFDVVEGRRSSSASSHEENGNG